VNNKIWLQQYPGGVPETINPDAYASLVELMEQSCTRFADKTAYVNMGATLTYRELDRLSRGFAAYLQDAAGFRKGDRVAIMMPNLLQYPVVLFGLLRAGLVVINVNPMYTARELEHQLTDSQARGLVIVENFAATAEKTLAASQVETVITTQVGDLFPFPKSLLVNLAVKHVKKMVPPWRIPNAVSLSQALKEGRSHGFDPPELGHDDIAFLQYTGGTTGVPKGAELTHGNMVANVAQSLAWVAPWLEEGREIIITALPLYHVFALTVNCLNFLKVGGKNVLITDPRDMPGFVKELSRHRFTMLTGVNTLFNGLLHAKGFTELDFSALKFAIGGGMAVQKAVAEKWQKVTGKPLIEGYGLTETSPAVTFNPPTLQGYNASIGVPLPSTEVILLNDDGEEVPTGEAGELCVRGPQVMRGYWQLPEETKKTFTEDGFLRTGDIARMDEKGYLYIVDRKKDMIVVSGFNVYPNEVEDIVAGHPGVRECACVGVADEKTGEAVKLFVVKADASLDEDTLIAYCRENLTAYKVPKQVEFRNDLPKSNVGKILRKELK
jgi:long-chain acyl-CoA synthetase